jgi:predicted alpha-1,2-mannosidase
VIEKNYTKACFALLWLLALGGFARAQQKDSANLTRFVDPYIGTGFHGHVFLGANVPFGAVQLGPTEVTRGWDWCSGYHYSDSLLIGFSHTHLSGTGIGDLGDILVMPATGEGMQQEKDMPKAPKSGYYSLFSHRQEKAAPGYYEVLLKRYGIKARLTASERVGFHQYTFPASADARVLIDLETGIGWDSPVDTYIEKVNDSTLAGYRFSKGWAPDQRIYFTAVFSKRFRSLQLFDSTEAKNGGRLKGVKVRAVAFFTTTANEKIYVKVGISPVGIQNSAANISAEIPGWDFEAVRRNADLAWNKELQKLRVTTISPARSRIFYTALYHTMIAPSAFNDHNGDYRGTDMNVYPKASFTNLTTFSLWDTYRAAHPLFTLLQPQRVNDMINTMLAIYQQQGKLPIWHLMGNETNTMPGNSAIPVIADAYLKGFRGFDVKLAYEAMTRTANRNERGLSFVKELGFIPADTMVESVAMGLEYSIDDWCLAQVAKAMGNQKDYEQFSRRGAYYKNYFDPSVGFMRGKLSATEWRVPFDPFISRHMKDDFTEGNAWQYTWLAPQDVYGLIQLQGGEQRFTQKLDSLFIVKGNLGKEASGDITGLIGQYAHGNEPSHHITYLYAWVGQPWKTADKVRFIMDSLYTAMPGGLCGNEDVGQMSAWYVLSALGFYPVNPAGGYYVFGSPLINSAVLQLPGGKSFSIRVLNNSAQNKYIQSIVLNGMPWKKTYILHSTIMAGGTITIKMGNKPSPTWGVAAADRPPHQ